MRKRASAWTASAFALVSLAGCANPKPEEIVTLENGVELPILEGTHLLPGCKLEGFKAPEGIVCIEYPAKLSEPPNEDVQNRYTALLLERGFRFEGGASVQYWFSWPTKDGCARPLKIASVPKTKPRSDGDWSTVDTFVLIMEFEPESCGAPNK